MDGAASAVPIARVSVKPAQSSIAEDQGITSSTAPATAQTVSATWSGLMKPESS
jgi:hypothetical protein